MVEYEYSDLYKQDSVDKQLIIEYDGGTITNELLHQENFSLQESLCSEDELTFGCCEASVVKFRVSSLAASIKGKKITIKETLAGNTDTPFQFGVYKVDTEVLTADRSWRDITAYDAMYVIINADVADWYNEILPSDDSTCTLKEFRDSFAEHFGLTQVDAELVNDSMTVTKTISVTATSGTGVTSTVGEAMSGKDVLASICEINGCFAHINRNGELEYKYLTQNIQGLYPADDLYPSDDLYPGTSDKATNVSKSLYTDCTYEDFLTESISKLQIRQEENDIGVIIGDGGNSYIIEDNFLVYGKGTDDLTTIGENIYSKIKGIIYRPFECTAKGNPCLEVGDAIRLSTKRDIIESYILQRTLKGIQALTDTYTAEGVEKYTEQVNSIQTSIKQIKGKANILTRTIEETQSQIVDVEEGLESSIEQTASEIRTEISNTKEGLESSIEQTASEIRAEVANADAGLQSSITQNADSITAEVSRAKTAESSLNDSIAETSTNLSSKIEQTAESITLSVSETYATKDETTNTSNSSSLASQIAVNAEAITSKVSKDGIISAINQTAEEVTIDASKINLNGAITANNNVTIGTDGKITANGATINGTVTTSNGTGEATLTSSELRFLHNSNRIATFGINTTFNGSSVDGLLVGTNYNSKYITFGKAQSSSAEDSYDTKLVFNYGLNPDGWTQEVILYGNMLVDQYLEFSAGSGRHWGFHAENWSQNGSYYTGGPYATGLLYASIAMAIGAWYGSSYAFSCKGAAYFSEDINVHGTAYSSDRNLKNTITSLDEETTMKFMLALRPVSYKWNDGTSGRLHYGLIAQEVKDAMDTAGIDSMDFAGYIERPKLEELEEIKYNEDGTPQTDADGNTIKTVVYNKTDEKEYALRYEEFISPLIKMVQMQEERIKTLEEEVAAIKEAMQ